MRRYGRAGRSFGDADGIVARFVPPDAGTFTYHSHIDDGWQLAGGLVGPLIVVPSGYRFDARSDHILMIAKSFRNADGPPFAITAGVRQRLRFADLTLGGENLVVSLSDGSHVTQWTPIAKDGRDLPLRAQQSATATRALTIGETRDFRFTPAHAGTLTVGVYESTTTIATAERGGGTLYPRATRRHAGGTPKTAVEAIVYHRNPKPVSADNLLHWLDGSDAICH